MIHGTSCWPTSITAGMHKETLDGRILEVFDGLPLSMSDMLRKTAVKSPDKVFLVDSSGCAYTYRQFMQRTEAFARYLYMELGVRAGDHIGILLYNCAEFAVALYAAGLLRAVAVPLPSKYRQPEILSLAGKADISIMICDEDFVPWFAEYPQPLHTVVCCGHAEHYGFSHLACPDCVLPDMPAQKTDDALILFTSGTTAMSKGVPLKNYNITHTIEAYRRIYRITEDDRSIISTPIYHVTGMIALLGLFAYTGSTLWLLPKVDPARVLRCVVENRLTFFHASPTVFQMLLDFRSDFPSLPSLTRIACGSCNMPAGTIRKLKDWLPQISFYTIYGMTEISSPGTTFPVSATDSPYITSSGIPIPGLDIKIVGDDGREVPNGTVGEITLYGTGVISGYYRQDYGLVDAEGYLHSNDIGYVNDEGYLWVVDRKKDMINRGGEKICAYDVENALQLIPKFRQSIVVGIPDPMYGEVPAAVIRLEPGAHCTVEQITAFLRTQIAKYQIPAVFRFVEEIPMTRNGKPDKAAARKLFQAVQN